jgi:metallophosphoesterase (TIGR03767 family)
LSVRESGTETGTVLPLRVIAFATAAMAALAGAAAAVAHEGATAHDMSGISTLEQTITGGDRSLGFSFLRRAAGEPYVVRSELASPRRGRERRRVSLTYLAQLTDFQLADEESPARVEWLDDLPSEMTGSAWRPQEAEVVHSVEASIRQVNHFLDSTVAQGDGTRARMDLAVMTGDLADNMQLNETEWVLRLLEGGTVEPGSGTRDLRGHPCSPSAIADFDDPTRYTGVQDYDDYPDVPADRYSGFWDPDQPPPTGGDYARFPRYPGLLERAQQPFQAEGLAVPWYAARGNHDGEVNGNVPGTLQIARSLITSGCKVFPSATFDPASLRGKSEEEIVAQFGDPRFQAALFGGVRTVPPDPDRRFVSTKDFKAEHGGGQGHGYAFVDRRELSRSNGTAAYYAFTPRRGTRFVSIDTVSEGGSQHGNIDDPQYNWLERELDRNSSTEVRGRRIVHDRDPDRLIVVYGRHRLVDMRSTNRDEAAGRCESDDDPAGCDADPRRSTPLHRGVAGRETLRDLFLRYPNVIAYVAGHSHENHLTPYARRDRRGGFWEINTASHADFPHQSRLIEIMDNRDGTLSFFGTILDSAAPIQPPPPGDAAAFNEAQLASLSRVIAANDPQGKGVPNPGYDPGLGRRRDRNAELVLADPRRLAR